MQNKKIIGLIGIIITITALILVSFRVINWKIFWITMILMFGLSYLLKKIK